MGRSKCGGSHFFPDPFQWDLDGDGNFGNTSNETDSFAVFWPAWYGGPSGDTIYLPVDVSDSCGNGARGWAVLNYDYPPTAHTGGPYTVAQGSSQALSGWGFDPENDISTYEWDLDGDGRYGETGGAAPCGDEVGWTPTFYAVDGPGSQEVRLLVYDTNGLHDSASALVNVTADTNGPTVALSGLDSVAEGGSTDVTASHSGNWSGNVSYAWDLDFDGIYDDGTGSSATFLADGRTGSYSVSVLATDPAGHRARAFKSIQVTNVPPTPTITSISTPQQEGTPITVTGSATDPGGISDTLTYSWTVLKDGAPFAADDGVDMTTFTFTPDDNGSYHITLTVTDLDGGSNSANETITVSNVAPGDLTLYVPSTTISEGGIITLSGSFTDPGQDTHTVTIQWDDGSSDTLSLDAGVENFTAPAHWYTLPAVYTISVTVPDAQSETVSGGLDITLQNQAPTVAVPAHAADNPVTSTSTTLFVLGDDAGGESNLTYSWSVVSGLGSVGFSENYTNDAKYSVAAFGAPGAYTLRVTIQDAYLLFATSEITVNVQPVTTVSLTPSSAIDEPEDTKQFAAAATDQFGNPVATTFTWSVSGVGSIDSSGLYTADVDDGLPHSVVVTATAATGEAGTARIVVTSEAQFRIRITGSGSANPGAYPDFEGSLTVVRPGWILADSISDALENRDTLSGQVTFVDDYTQETYTLSFPDAFDAAPGEPCTWLAGESYDSVRDVYTDQIQFGRYRLDFLYYFDTEIDWDTPPLAYDDAYEIMHDAPLVGSLSYGDAEQDQLTPFLVSLPSHFAAFDLDPEDGSFSYTPAYHYVGQDTFTYYVNDGHFESNVASVTINVRDNAPVAGPDGPYMTLRGIPLSVPAPGLLGNDYDVDADPFEARFDGTPMYGSLGPLNPDGSFEYIPGSGFTGTDMFTYKAYDQMEYSDPTTVRLGVADLSLYSLTFGGAHQGEHNKVVADPGRPDYNGAEWLDANGDGDADDPGDHKYPTSYVRGTTLTVSAAFYLDRPWEGSGTILVRATGPDNINIPWTVATVGGPFNDEVSINNVPAGNFRNAVWHYDDFQLQWYATVQGQETLSMDVGTSSNDLYLTYAQPHLTAMPLHETLVNLGSHAAIGDTTQEAVLNDIWYGVFSTKNISQNAYAVLRR
jgi:hypothetical protein